MQKPTITLVGAGPGDPELISIKGAKALTKAKVILYDALVHPDTLDYADDTALKIYVGKRAGKHKCRQEAINKMLVDYAFSHGDVVRLKGGDPFIFGRGHEELEYAQAFGIQVNVIPGISSVNTTALEHIPLTKRGINESFWVITATKSDGQLAKDVWLAAQSTATVVLLMGVRKLPQIVALFKRIGKGNTPVAMIQNGSLDTQKIALGKVDNIVEVALEKDIQAPAIIVIGETVRLHPKFNYQPVIEAHQKIENSNIPESSSNAF